MTSERVLVVDDDSAMLHSLVRLLEGRYAVTGAASGEQALELVAAEPPDLAVLDVRMPGMDGFTLAARLRELHPGVDVILITGEVHEVDTQVVRAIREGAFYFVQKPFDREVLQTIVERCLELRRLAKENQRYVQRMEVELADARSFQRSILPPDQVQTGCLELQARYSPCTELGGDFYDYALLPDGGLAFLVADVSGHGVTAAMLTATLKSAFHETLPQGFAPDAVVKRVAGAIRSFDVGRFVTLFAARIDGQGGMTWVNAGHPAPMIVPAGGAAEEVRRLPLTGPMVSPAFPELHWERQAEVLAEGESLWVFTDGLSETRSEDGQLFGEQRLVDLAAGGRAAEQGLDELLALVREHAGGRPIDDDLTLLRVLRTTGSGASNRK